MKFKSYSGLSLENALIFCAPRLLWFLEKKNCLLADCLNSMSPCVCLIASLSLTPVLSISLTYSFRPMTMATLSDPNRCDATSVCSFINLNVTCHLLIYRMFKLFIFSLTLASLLLNPRDTHTHSHRQHQSVSSVWCCAHPLRCPFLLFSFPLVYT